ncbi:MAG: prohibitin family protein [Nitrososphaera sp.]|nr:prohibitin family protein [Nitrososphaera sp.]
MKDRGIGAIVCAVGIAVFTLIFGYTFCFVTVKTGHVGVVDWFGDVSNATLEPGPHFVHPMKGVRRVPIQTRKNEESSVVVTKNALTVNIKAVMQYHLSAALAPKMIREVGINYEEVLIDSIFRDAIRDACAEFDAEALYTVDREKVQAKVIDQLEKKLAPRGIVIEGVQLLDPVMPEVVKARIEQKVAAEQDVARMQFMLKQKELEAQAKIVEANGIAKAQAIIKQDLTHEYLVYLWIEALKESAKHNNATIYIPTGQDGMPFFKPIQPKGK